MLFRSSKNRLNFILVFVSIVSISLIIALISIIALTKKNKNISKLSYTLQASEKDLIIALAEAEKANKTKTTFLRSMSHEIRTPLNAVLGFSEVLLNSIPNNEENLETKEYIQAINKCADSLLIMANDIVNLVKLEDGKYTLQISEVNLNSLCSKLYLEAQSSN